MAYTTIDNPSEHFQPVLFTGSTSNITVDIDMRPDFFWFKSRTQTYSHLLYDTSRPSDGTSMPSGDVNMYASLSANNTDAESDNNTDGLVQTSTGFIVDGDGQAIGEAGQGTNNMVAWCWKANGGTTTSVSATGTAHESTMAGTHQANTIAGFSIVTFSTASEDLGDKLITHGIGKKPEWIIMKSRSSGDWYCHHISANTNDSKYIRLNLTNAPSDSGSRNTFDTSNITTTQFAVDHNNIVADNHNHVAYVFAPIQGYSKFGSYTGNGNADGPFVYTGFKPAFVITKRTDTAKNWYMFDNKRTPFNVIANLIAPNLNSAEDSGTGTYIDFLSNGFKLRQDFSHMNASGGTHIYIAFAEHPFVSSEGVPVTAR